MVKINLQRKKPDGTLGHPLQNHLGRQNSSAGDIIYGAIRSSWGAGGKSLINRSSGELNGATHQIRGKQNSSRQSHLGELSGRNTTHWSS